MELSIILVWPMTYAICVYLQNKDDLASSLIHISHSISNHIVPIVKYILNLGRIIDTWSAITDFMEFNIMLEKSHLHMLASYMIQVGRHMSHRSSVILGLRSVACSCFFMTRSLFYSNPVHIPYSIKWPSCTSIQGRTFIHSGCPTMYAY
jgi:hypothetical protein